MVEITVIGDSREVKVFVEAMFNARRQNPYLPERCGGQELLFQISQDRPDTEGGDRVSVALEASIRPYTSIGPQTWGQIVKEHLPAAGIALLIGLVIFALIALRNLYFSGAPF